MDNTRRVTEIQIYDKLYASVKKAADKEQQLRDEAGTANKAAIKRLEGKAANELPEFMGKMISGLGLQQQFQSLGRYVRSFTDAEFVVRNLKDQIISNFFTNDTAQVAIDNLISCSDSIGVL
jgi:hypothetical protein